MVKGESEPPVDIILERAGLHSRAGAEERLCDASATSEEQQPVAFQKSDKFLCLALAARAYAVCAGARREHARVSGPRGGVAER